MRQSWHLLCDTKSQLGEHRQVGELFSCADSRSAAQARNIETLHYAAYLSDAFSRFWESGYTNPLVETRSTLLADGVALAHKFAHKFEHPQKCTYQIGTGASLE